MATQMGAQHLIGHRLLDRDGNNVGKIGQVFFDDQTDRPTWVTVRTGLLGTKESFVPLRGATMVDDALQVAFTSEQIAAAPSFATNQHLSVHHEDMIYRHYGIGPEVPAQRAPEGQPQLDKDRYAHDPVGTDSSGSGGIDPVGNEGHVFEPIQAFPTADIADDPRVDGFEREGVRVLRPSDGDSPTIS